MIPNAGEPGPMDAQLPAVAGEAEVLPPVPQIPANAGSLLAVAVQNGLPIETIERLTKLLHEEQERQARVAFFAAMTKFQAMCPVLDKDAEVDFTGDRGRVYYKHTSLGLIAETIREPCRECDLSYRFEYTPSEKAGFTTVSCVVTHVLGHSERTKLDVPCDASGKKNPIQALGSGLSYAQRYTVLPAFGLVTGIEDTDGRQRPGGPPSGDDPPCNPDAWQPGAPPAPDPAKSIRGPFGFWIREIRDERAEGATIRRELLLRDWPDNWVLVSKSKFEKYKPDGHNEWKNAGVGRPGTCNVADGKHVRDEIWFLAETLRHPAATGAVVVPCFNWQEDANGTEHQGTTGEAGPPSVSGGSADPRIHLPHTAGDDPDDNTVEAVRIGAKLVEAYDESRELDLRAECKYGSASHHTASHAQRAEFIWKAAAWIKEAK